MTSKPNSRIHDLIVQQATQRPDSLAIIDTDGSEHIYAEYQAAIISAAAILQESGVEAGDRVMLVAENCLATAVFIFATSTVGACCVPVNARMTQTELTRVIEHAKPCVTVYMTGVSKEAVAHADIANAAKRTSDFGIFAIAETTHNNPDFLADDEGETAVILYTTGTTGAPKGVMLTHANLRFAGLTSSTFRGMVSDDRIYGVLPLTHVFGLASMLMASSHVGAAAQLEVRFQPHQVYAALMDGVTVFPAVPQMHALLMQYTKEQGVERLENSQLRYISSGAAPLDPAWKRKAEVFYGLALQNGYGMTESTAGFCATHSLIGTPDTSVGQALPDTEIKLDTSIGASADVETGEILTRGPHVMKGYFRNADETAKTIDDEGWLRTGDLGQFDAVGNLHVVGRLKELIIRGGFNIYPPEVEAALNDHPDVIQSAVIGRTIEGGNEEVLAFVQCVDPSILDVDALAMFVSERLTSYKRPSLIIPVGELPAAVTGKVLKHKLLSTFCDLLTTE